jgi:DNA-binding NarL/FixJ family response regulator
MTNKIKIMLVEDSPAYRKATSEILKNTPGMELISEFGTAEIALRSLQDMSTRRVPDLMLLDLRLPGLSGIDALPYFRKSIPETKIIILTQSSAKMDLMNAVRVGIEGYLLKNATQEQIVSSIRSVMDGGVSLDTYMASFTLDAIKDTVPENRQKTNLSNREMEVLHLIAEGRQKKEIATDLGLSVWTINTHMKNIYGKLEVKNAPAAVHKAFRSGILSPTNTPDHIQEPAETTTSAQGLSTKWFPRRRLRAGKN